MWTGRIHDVFHPYARSIWYSISNFTPKTRYFCPPCLIPPKIVGIFGSNIIKNRTLTFESLKMEDYAPRNFHMIPIRVTSRSMSCQKLRSYIASPLTFFKLTLEIAFFLISEFNKEIFFPLLRGSSNLKINNKLIYYK